MSEKKRQTPLLKGLKGKARRQSENPNPRQKDIPLGRPFTLPTGLFRPKQSLGQNFLTDQNYVSKICDAFVDTSEGGKRVVEIGPGPGSLSKTLYPRYPDMTAIEIDQRAVAMLKENLPDLKVLHMNVLDFDWPALAFEKGGQISVIANLPYYIVSQVLFSLADSHKSISKAVVTMQLEVAQRVTAKPSTKDYGIPSVVFQLYGTTKMNFKIPPNVFYPVPKVDSALVTIDFTKPHKDLHRVNGDHLRKVVSSAFRQRRKMMRRSLKDLCETEGLTLPEKWSTLRPEQLQPAEFIELTADLFGEVDGWKDHSQGEPEEKEEQEEVIADKSYYSSQAIWRTSLFGHKKKNYDKLEGRTGVDEEDVTV